MTVLLDAIRLTGFLSTLFLLNCAYAILPPTNASPANLAMNVSAQTTLMWNNGEFIELVKNGDFETGTLTNWTQFASANGQFIINDGTYDPPNPDGPLPPFDGNFRALGIQTGGNIFGLYQDISIPTNAWFAMLSWAHRTRNFGVAYNPFFQVRICDSSNAVLATAYITSTNDPLLGDWMQKNYNMKSFSGQTIRLMFWIDVFSYYEDVHLDDVSVQVGFLSSDITNDIYFGTNPAPGPAEYQGSTTNSFWTPPLLLPLTTYYWQVVTHKDGTEIAGPVWQFTTAGVDHFAWSDLPPIQTFNRPFSVTITAKDTFNSTVTNFTGSVTLSSFKSGQTNQPISITPTNTADFVNGAWTGDITVLSAATNMELRASDTTGHSGVSSFFDVTYNNDLAVYVSASPNPAVAGTNLNYVITVFNTGPAMATGVMVTNILPAGVGFVSAMPSQGGCTNMGGIVTANLGAILGGTNATIEIVVMPPMANLVLTNLATVTHAELDPSYGNNSAVTLTAVGPPTVSISADASVGEGDSGTTNIVFNVNLSAPSALPISVNYSAANGTADFGDYFRPPGLLTFFPGTTNRTVTVFVVGDALIESNETFFVNISNPTNVVISRGQAVATILDDDGQPGKLDHFTWDTISSPQAVNKPFAVRISACNVQGVVLADFTNTVAIEGFTTTNRSTMIEDFESGTTLHDPWIRRSSNLTAVISAASAHDGNFGAQSLDPMFRTDIQIGNPGDVLSVWINPSSIPGSSAILGFAASSSGSWFLAASAQSGQLELFNSNSSVVKTVSQSWQLGKWYRLEVRFVSTSILLCSLYDSDGTTVLSSFTYSPFTGSPAGVSLAANGGFSMDTLQATGVRVGTIPVYPESSARFTAGVFTTNLTVSMSFTNMYAGARDANGHIGFSNPFNVVVASSPTGFNIQAAPDGGVQLMFNGNPNWTYRIQYTDTLAPTQWQDLTNVTADPAGAVTFMGTTTNSPARFYRAVWP